MSDVLLLLRALLPESPRHIPLPQGWNDTRKLQALSHLCHHHRMPGWVLRQLGQMDPDQIWIDRSALKTSEALRRPVALAHLAEGLRLIHRLKQADIPAYTVKGPLLCQRLYGDPCMHQARDMDFWVVASTACIEGLSSQVADRRESAGGEWKVSTRFRSEAALSGDITQSD